MQKLEFNVTDAAIYDVDEPIRKAARATREAIESSLPHPLAPVTVSGVNEAVDRLNAAVFHIGIDHSLAPRRRQPKGNQTS